MGLILSLIEISKSNTFRPLLISVNVIESVNGTNHETVATIYHRQRHVPIVKHVCPTTTKPSQVVFGLGLNIFTHRLLFLDAIHYSSGGALAGSLSRYLQGFYFYKN